MLRGVRSAETSALRLEVSINNCSQIQQHQQQQAVLTKIDDVKMSKCIALINCLNAGGSNVWTLDCGTECYTVTAASRKRFPRDRNDGKLTLDL